MEESYRSSEPFDKAIEQVEKLEYIAKVFHSKINLNKLAKIKKELKIIKLNLLDKPIVFSAAVRNWPDRVDKLILLFKEQLPPETPDYTIAVAIAKLLRAFNIHTEKTAILRRMERRKD